MNRASLSLALFSLSLFSLSACTSATSHSGDGGSGGTQPGAGGSSAGTGGSPSGTGGSSSGAGGTTSSAGGATAGTGGSSAGTGGATGAGGASAIFKCPMPPASYTPLASTSSLPAPQPLTGVPPADNYGNGFSIIEGPVWLGGALYVSQLQGGNEPAASRLLKVIPGSAATVIAPADGSNGLAILPDGDLVGGISLALDGSEIGRASCRERV